MIKEIYKTILKFIIMAIILCKYIKYYKNDLKIN